MVDKETEDIIYDVVRTMLSLDPSKSVRGSLKSCIDSHGPIDLSLIGSATKRVVHGMRSLKRDRVAEIFEKYDIVEMR